MKRVEISRAALANEAAIGSINNKLHSVPQGLVTNKTPMKPMRTASHRHTEFASFNMKIPKSATMIGDVQASAAAVGIATAKASLPFVAAFTKGVLCNWLVCLAVWGTMATTSVAGKILAIFWPITMFVALGFEHSVANMFLIPHGMLLGANVSWAQMMTGNIIPVTLGNIVGAAVFVAGVHWLAYGKK